MEVSEMMAMLATHAEKISSLEEHRERQNGCIQRVENKLDKIYFWLVGLMGGVVTSLILLLVNIKAGK